MGLYLLATLFTLPIVSANFWQATTFAQTQALVPPHMRAQAAALMLFIANIIGLGCGPWAIGLVSDLLTPRFGADALRWSMLGFMLIAPWTAWHYFRGGQLLPGDIARVDHPE